MAQAPTPLAPFSDWLPVHMQSMLWFSNGAGQPADAGLGYQADQFDAVASADVQGGAMPKPTQVLSPLLESVSMAFSLPIPDFVVFKQPGRLPPWDGVLGAEMDDSGGRRVALQIEIVLASIDNQENIGADPDLVALSAKYRGEGARVLTPPTGSTGDTQDTPIGAAFPGGAFPGAPLGSVFGDMALPSTDGATGAVDPNGENSAVSFLDNGVARLQWIIEVPSTIAVGDLVEIICLTAFAGSGIFGQSTPSTVPVQFQSVKYRWVTTPYPFAPNSGIQLVGQSSFSRDQLEEQSREDGDNDASPYSP